MTCAARSRSGPRIPSAVDRAPRRGGRAAFRTDFLCDDRAGTRSNIARDRSAARAEATRIESKSDPVAHRPSSALAGRVERWAPRACARAAIPPAARTASRSRAGSWRSRLSFDRFASGIISRTRHDRPPTSHRRQPALGHCPGRSARRWMTRAASPSAPSSAGAHRCRPEAPGGPASFTSSSRIRSPAAPPRTSTRYRRIPRLPSPATRVVDVEHLDRRAWCGDASASSPKAVGDLLAASSDRPAAARRRSRITRWPFRLPGRVSRSIRASREAKAVGRSRLRIAASPSAGSASPSRPATTSAPSSSR